MNKLLTKIVGTALGLSMTVGVGVAVATSQKSVVKANAATLDSAITTFGEGKYLITLDSDKYYVTSFDGNYLGLVAVPNGGVTKISNPETYAFSIIASNDWMIFDEATEKYLGYNTSTKFKEDANPGNDTKYQYTTEKKAGSTNEFVVTNVSSSRFLAGNAATPATLRPYSTLASGASKYLKFYPIQDAKEVNHITAVAKSANWYAGETFKTSDVTVTPYFSSDNSDPGTPISDGDGVKFGNGADLDSVALTEGINEIKVNYDGKSVTVNVTAAAARTLSSIVVTTAPTKTTYTVGETFDSTGMTVTATYSSGTADVTSSCTFSPSGALALNTTSITISYTYLGVTRSTTQSISVIAAPTTINIVAVAETGKWVAKPSGSTFTDSSGNTATLTTDAGWFGTTTPLQYGKNNNGDTINAASYVEIIIPLSSKAGIESVSATFKSNGATSVVTLTVYGDTDNDVILNASVTGNSTMEKKQTGNSYEKINASRLKYRFDIGGTGVFIEQITYQLGATVAEFGTMTDLQILTPTTDTQFKVGDTFSASGLVLRATDDSEPVMTKDLTTGFKFGTSKNDNSFSGHIFNSTDAETGSFTVHVTATIGSVTLDVTYGITVTEVPTYSLVSDYSSLYEGAKVIIVAGSYAFGTFNVGSYGNPVEPEFTDGVVTDANGATEFTVRIYGNKFGLQFGSYYLSLNGDNTQVHRNNTLTDAGAWEKDDTGILSPVAGRYLRYITGNPANRFACATSGTDSALYISNKSVNTDASKADTFTYRYLHMRDYLGTEGQDGAGYCKNTGDGAGKNYFADAATAYAGLSADVKTEFKKNTEAVKRFNAWAAACGKSIDLDTGDVTAASRAIDINYMANSTNAAALIAIVSVISLSAVAGFFLLRKRKEQ